MSRLSEASSPHIPYRGEHQDEKHDADGVRAGRHALDAGRPSPALPGRSSPRRGPSPSTGRGRATAAGSPRRCASRNSGSCRGPPARRKRRLVGADHSGLRDLVGREHHQHDQQSANASCPCSVHECSWGKVRVRGKGKEKRRSSVFAAQDEVRYSGRHARITTHGRFATTRSAAARLDRRRSALRRRRARRVRLRRVQLPAGADRRRAAALASRTSSPRVAACREHGAPILARGGGTSLCGQSVNVAVVIDCSKYLRPRAARSTRRARIALVEPGVVCDALRDAAERHGLTFAPDPATHSRCTLGGMIGNNSCGAHSVMAGKTVENIEALEVLTYDGARFWCGPTAMPRSGASSRRRPTGGDLRGAARRSPTSYGELIRSRLPEDQAPRLGLQPRPAAAGERLQRGARAGRLAKAPARSRCRRRRDWCRARSTACCWCRASRTSIAAGDAVPQILAARPIACEGLDEAIIGGLRERGLQPRRHRAPAPGQGLADGGVRRRIHGEEASEQGEEHCRTLIDRPRR